MEKSPEIVLEFNFLISIRTLNSYLVHFSMTYFCISLFYSAARPSSRWGHSLCFVNKNMSVLVGGQGDKQQLNKDAVWTLDTGSVPFFKVTTTITFEIDCSF